MRCLLRLGLVVGAAWSVSGSLRGGRRLQDVEMVPAEEAAQLEAAEEAQREQASAAAAEAAAKLEAALKAAEEAKAEKAAAEARLAETPEVTVEEEPIERQAVEEVAPKAATPEAATPEAATPEAATPEAATPEAATPEAAATPEEAPGATPDLQGLAHEAEALVEQLKSALATEETLLGAVTAKLAEIERAQGGGGGATVVEDASKAVIVEDAEATETSRKLSTATWNMAAINNNPFEYWITYEGEGADAYQELMDAISEFLSDPGDGDVAVSTIFTDEMLTELIQTMEQASLATSEELERVTNTYWQGDYRNRKIVSGILKDKSLGSKRLVSMPDRVTNTIQLADGSKAMRPTVINCYDGELPDVAAWWSAWREFMFATSLETTAGSAAKAPIAMLPKIVKAKYPAIELDEEALSIPLSATLLAVFDAVLVKIVNDASSRWQPIRRSMCEALNQRKNDRTAEILETDLYADDDVIFLQESSMTFANLAKGRRLGELYDVLAPTEVDQARDQNSLILLKKGAWTNAVDVTAQVTPRLFDEATQKSKVALGDLCVYTATRVLDSKTYLLASFHGDTNGLATIPVVDAVHYYRKHTLAEDQGIEASLLFGLDANTHFQCVDDDGNKFRACVTEFAASFKGHHINSVYGDNADDPNSYGYTTFNARTYLQPQLNKAVKESEKTTSPLVDKNPKDFVLFYDDDFKLAEPALKDNTGDGTFLEGVVFPTLTFPSDHAITRAVLVDNKFDANAQPDDHLPTASI